MDLGQSSPIIDHFSLNCIGLFNSSLSTNQTAILPLYLWHKLVSDYKQTVKQNSGAAVGDCLCCWHLNTLRIECIFLKTCVLTSLIWAIYSLISMLKTGDQAFSPKMDFKRLRGPKFKRTKAPKWVLWQNLFAENNQFQFLQNTLRRIDWDASEHNAGKWQMLKFRGKIWKYEILRLSKYYM